METDGCRGGGSGAASEQLRRHQSSSRCPHRDSAGPVLPVSRLRASGSTSSLFSVLCKITHDTMFGKERGKQSMLDLGVGFEMALALIFLK